MKNTMTVYRFRDLVAINPPTSGETFYLTATEAVMVVDALYECYIELLVGVPFSESDCSKTIEVEHTVR